MITILGAHLSILALLMFGFAVGFIAGRMRPLIVSNTDDLASTTINDRHDLQAKQEAKRL